MVAELETGWKEESTVYKNSFTLDEVHEREKPLMLELNKKNKEVERLEIKLAALHHYFNGIYNDTLLPPLGSKGEKDKQKERLADMANSRKNKEVMRELVYQIPSEVPLPKLTFMEKLKGLFHTA